MSWRVGRTGVGKEWKIARGVHRRLIVMMVIDGGSVPTFPPHTHSLPCAMRPSRSGSLMARSTEPTALCGIHRQCGGSLAVRRPSSPPHSPQRRGRNLFTLSPLYSDKQLRRLIALFEPRSEDDKPHGRVLPRLTLPRTPCAAPHLPRGG